MSSGLEPSPPARYCRNCGAPLSGEYCADCGQKGDVHVPTTAELLHEALEGITHSDSRVWLSLQYLLFVPGKLTAEFIAGRRVSYLPPFRLYLVLSVAFFLMTSISHTTMLHIDSATKAPSESCRDLHINLFGSSGEEQRFRQACERILLDQGRNFQHVVIATIPKAMFIFLPLIAFFHMLLYWRPRHRYAEHLLFFIHAHAFAFLAMSLLLLLNALGETVKSMQGATNVLMAALSLYIPVYVVMAMRRVFKGGRLSIFFKACLLFSIYATVLALTMAGVVIYALYQV